MISRRYSDRPITQFQFLMLQAMESGAELTPAMQHALDVAAEHPDWDVFQRAPYRDWADGRGVTAAGVGTSTT